MYTLGTQEPHTPHIVLCLPIMSEKIQLLLASCCCCCSKFSVSASDRERTNYTNVHQMHTHTHTRRRRRWTAWRLRFVRSHARARLYRFILRPQHSDAHKHKYTREKTHARGLHSNQALARAAADLGRLQMPSQNIHAIQQYSRLVERIIDG